MKQSMRSAAMVLGIMIVAAAPVARAQIGTAFTYQGSLEDGGAPANGNYDMIFNLWDDEFAGSTVGNPSAITFSGATPNGTVAVTRGLFRVTLDFGVPAFDGNPRWLDFFVRAEDPTDTQPYFPLDPRVALLPVPYAIRADSAATADLATNAINDAVNDADADPANELQNLAAVLAQGSNAGGVGAVNLGPVGIGVPAAENRLHVDGGSDASLAGGGYLQINEATAGNLVMDENEIMARTNGAGATLFVNHEGGNVVLAGQGNGNVGIGTGLAAPGAPLHVNGTVRMGSEAGTSQTPGDGSFTYEGIVHRRIRSTIPAAGFVVARTDSLRLERDDTNGGFRVAWDASPGNEQQVTGWAVTSGGTLLPIHLAIGSPVTAGSQPVVTNAQNVVRLDLWMGNAYNKDHHAEVNLARWAGDHYWVGTVVSTFDQ